MNWGELGALPGGIALLTGCSEVDLLGPANGALGLLLLNAALTINPRARSLATGRLTVGYMASEQMRAARATIVRTSLPSARWCGEMLTGRRAFSLRAYAPLLM